MKKLTTEEIKKIELDILISFDSFCKEYNIKYYLAGGTLLGAIRHKGFIPWDDDIDVCMLRKDYENMLTIMKEKNNVLNENLLFASYETSDFYLPFSKIYDKTTYTVCSDNPFHDGIWLDIFPIDYVYNESNFYFKKIRFYRALLLAKLINFCDGPKLKYYIKRILKVLLFLIPKKTLTKKLIKLAKGAKQPSNKVACQCWGYGKKEIMPISIFNGYKEAKFENHYFSIIPDYDTYLTNLYGNYMVPPKDNQRNNHGFDAYLKEE